MRSAAYLSHRLRRGEAVALAISVAWSLALLMAAFLAPVYDSVSGSSADELSRGSDTLVGVNGVQVALVVAVPLLLSIVAVGVLTTRGQERGAGPVAWTVAGIAVAFSLIAVLSIGPFVLPVAACLIYACVVHGSAVRPRPR